MRPGPTTRDAFRTDRRCLEDRAARCRECEIAGRQSRAGKDCPRCGKRRPITQFSHDDQREDGLLWECKACARKRNVDYVAAQNPDKRLEAGRAWRRAHAELIAGAPPIEHYRALIEAALAHSGGSHQFEDVVAGVESGQMQFWAGPHSVIITQLCVSPRTKTLLAFLCAGDRAEIERMIPLLESWGRTEGCTAVELIGRPGWARSGIVKGWHVDAIIMRKSLV